jgi:hypothetical protein
MDLKVRYVERMVRLMLAAYVGCESPNLLIEEAVEYTRRHKGKAGDPWEELVRRAIDVEDDWHAAKFVRGLIHSQILSAKHEDNPAFMTKGDMWLKVYHMCRLFAIFLGMYADFAKA